MRPITQSGAGEAATWVLSDLSLLRPHLPPLTEREWQSLELNLDRVVRDALSWCETYPFLNPSIVVPSAVWLMVQAPGFPPRSTAALVKGTLWAIALDDMFDKELLPEKDLLQVVLECQTVACQRSPLAAQTSQYAKVLADLKTDLSSYPLWPDLEPYWVASLVRMLDGMVYEYSFQQSLRQGSPLLAPPPTELYLHFGTYTSLVPMQWTAAVVLAGDYSVLPVLPGLMALIQQCGLVLRLINDLWTFPRELEEQTTNSLLLEKSRLAWSGEANSEQEGTKLSRDKLERRLEQELRKARELAAGIETPTEIEKGFIRALDFGLRFYAQHDLRDWQREVEQQLQSAPPRPADGDVRL